MAGPQSLPLPGGPLSEPLYQQHPAAALQFALDDELQYPNVVVVELFVEVVVVAVVEVESVVAVVVVVVGTVTVVVVGPALNRFFDFSEIR